MPTPSFILPTSVPVVDATVEALRVYDGSPAGFDVLPMSFTRGSSATLTDSAGNIVEAVPYNLFTYSEQFDNGAWLKTWGTVLANSTTSPAGTTTADTYIVNSGQPSNSPIIRYLTLLPNTTYTLSLFVKKKDYDLATIRIFTTETGFSLCSFNLSTGTATVGTIVALPDGWFRVSATLTTSSTVTNSQIQLIRDAEIRDGVAGIYIWGAQLVLGTQPLPYQETVTRLALPRLDYINADGTLSSTPRLLLEPQRTNSIRNSTMVGAVVGSPGTWPTGWLSINTAGLTNSVVGIGTENGLQYIDMRYNGIATGTGIRIGYTLETQTAALTGQVWTITNYLKIISQPNPPYAYFLRDTERNSSGVVVASDLLSIVPTTTLQRFTFVKTLNGGATTAYVVPELQIQTIIGQAYDFTIRIAAPQMELGSYATTFIPTSTAAVTRLADVCSLTGASSIIGQTQGTIFVEFEYNQATSDPNGRFLQLWSTNDTTNAISPLIFGLGANANQFQLNVYSNGVINVPITGSASTVIPFGRQKIAVAYNNGVYTVYRNGSLFASGSGSAPVSLSGIDLGSNSFAARSLGNPITKAALYTTRLSDSELQSLTTL